MNADLDPERLNQLMVTLYGSTYAEILGTSDLRRHRYEIQSVLTAYGVSELEDENRRFRRALTQIASCEVKWPGDVVDIARAALAPREEGSDG